MNKKNENFWAYVSLGIYAVFGVSIRYYVIPFCTQGLEGVTFLVGFVAVLFLIIGIAAGLYSFIFQEKRLSRIASGIVTGFAVGFGGMTIIALLFIPCV